MNNNNMNNNNMFNNNVNNNNMRNNNMNNNFMNNNNMMMNNMNNMNNMMMNNMINNNNIIIKNKFDKVFNLYNEQFIITVKETQSKIILECKPNEEFISLYDYSIELSLEDFYAMGKSFKQCDNLNEIFNLIRNLMFQVNLPQINNYYIPVNNSNNLNLQVAPTPNSNNMQPYVEFIPFNNSNNLNLQVAPTPNSNIMQPNVRLESNNNESYDLLFHIPLFNGKYEDIKIEFLKFGKNIYHQYEKLKNKYFRIKSIAFDSSDKPKPYFSLSKNNNQTQKERDYYSRKLTQIQNEINNIRFYEIIN